MRDPRGPRAAAGVSKTMTLGKQSPRETNKLFGVRERTVLGVGEGGREKKETKTHTRRASEGPKAPRLGPGLLLALPPLGGYRASSDAIGQPIPSQSDHSWAGPPPTSTHPYPNSKTPLFPLS
jgi:hypothetical protein